MIGYSNIFVINKAIKKVELGLNCTILYDISYVNERDVYEYTEYVKDKGVVSVNSKYDISTIDEVKNTLKDICSHYGSLDYVLYNNENEVRDVVIDTTTDSL